MQMRLMVAFFLLALIVSLQQAVSATDTCSVTSDGTVTTLTGDKRNMELSSEKIRVFEVVDEDNPTCNLLVRTRQNANGEISWVAVRLIKLYGRHKRAYQFDLLSRNVVMRGQGFKNPETIKNFPHTWTATGITVTETEGGWTLSHSECGYVITVAEMEDRVLDITIPGRDQLPYAVGPCALSADCDVEFVNLPSTDTGFEIDPSAFKLIGVCDGRNLYKGFDKDPDNDIGVIYLYILSRWGIWQVGETPCVNWGFMFSHRVDAPEEALRWAVAMGEEWNYTNDVLAQCTTSV